MYSRRKERKQIARVCCERSLTILETYYVSADDLYVESENRVTLLTIADFIEITIIMRASDDGRTWLSFFIEQVCPRVRWAISENLNRINITRNTIN